MNRIFYDFEFLEGKQDKRFLGIKYGETKPTIDVISVGMVNENGDEYYAISKDFNLYEAWNRYDLVWEQTYGDMRNHFPDGITKKVYWIREKVLKPIFEEMFRPINDSKDNNYRKFTYSNFKYMIGKYGKTNKQIAKEVKFFIADSNNNGKLNSADYYSQLSKGNENIFFKNTQLVGYYCAYDHLCLVWLFGKMIDLPKGLPMYTFDLKQEFDRKQILNNEQKRLDNTNLSDLKLHLNYPKQENEHNALADARWNKKLYEFLKTL